MIEVLLKLLVFFRRFNRFLNPVRTEFRPFICSFFIDNVRQRLYILSGSFVRKKQCFYMHSSSEN